MAGTAKDRRRGSTDDMFFDSVAHSSVTSELDRSLAPLR